MTASSQLPQWAFEVLRDPESGEQLKLSGCDVFTAESGALVGTNVEGVLRLPILTPDLSIDFYRRAGGAHFHERAAIPFAMSSLDTAIYHRYLRDVKPAQNDALIVDVGGGDGRNAWPWLHDGYKRVVVIDAVADALLRFRQRVAALSPDYVERILFVEADARRLPLATACADLVVAIEVLYYLNDDYEAGVRECGRVLKPGSTFIVSERDFEGGLLMRLLYDGVDAMLQTAREHALWDGKGNSRVKTRCFTESELCEVLTSSGFEIMCKRITPLLSLVLGWMNGRDQLSEPEMTRISEVRALLEQVSHSGTLRRCHIISAQRVA